MRILCVCHEEEGLLLLTRNFEEGFGVLIVQGRYPAITKLLCRDGVVPAKLFSWVEVIRFDNK